MRIKRNFPKLLRMVLALLFFLVVSAEGFVHHHPHNEGKDPDCAYCHWDYTGAQAVIHAVQPLIFPSGFYTPILERMAGAPLASLSFYTGSSPPVSLSVGSRPG